MNAATFDTLKFAKRLKDAGIPEEQAEAQTEALASAFETKLEEVATRADLRELDLKMETQLLKINAQLLVLKWMVGVMLAGVVSLIMKAFLIP